MSDGMIIIDSETIVCGQRLLIWIEKYALLLDIWWSVIPQIESSV